MEIIKLDETNVQIEYPEIFNVPNENSIQMATDLFSLPENWRKLPEEYHVFFQENYPANLSECWLACFQTENGEIAVFADGSCVFFVMPLNPNEMTEDELRIYIDYKYNIKSEIDVKVESDFSDEDFQVLCEISDSEDFFDKTIKTNEVIKINFYNSNGHCPCIQYIKGEGLEVKNEKIIKTIQ